MFSLRGKPVYSLVSSINNFLALQLVFLTTICSVFFVVFLFMQLNSLYPCEFITNMFSASCVGICFGWITPLMKQGYRKPVTEKDVWKLDKWDETETLAEKFVFCFLHAYYMVL